MLVEQLNAVPPDRSLPVVNHLKEQNAWRYSHFCNCVTDPRLTDYDMLLENIHGLKQGKPVQVPIYDFKMSCRTGYRLDIFHLKVNHLYIYMYMYVL